MRVSYSPSVFGVVAGYRLAGIEPDGDPLDEVALKTKLSTSGSVPAINLIVDAYLENFKPDTTPILPDLLHPNRTAQNLGGFLQGKVLLTDDAGQVLYIGSFLAEAFLDGSNHAVMSFDGQGAAKGASGALKGSFRLHKDGTLAGPFTGHIELPLAARRQLLQHQGAKMRPLQEILDQVTVKPSAMRGRATTPSTSVPLHTGFGQPKSKLPYSAPQSTSSSRHLSPLTIVAGIGAILSFLIAGILFWLERRRAPA